MRNADAKGTLYVSLRNAIKLALLTLLCGCVTRPLAEQTCTITGRVVAADGNAPIAGARVLVSVLGMDQSTSPYPFGLTYVGITGPDGRYAIAGVPVLADDSVQLIAKAKGYQTPWNADSKDEPLPEVVLREGVVEAAELKLKKGDPFFCSGIVVDEVGRPIKGVTASLSRLIDITDDSGSFQIIDESMQTEPADFVIFSHPDYVSAWINDLTRTPVAERERMRIVLKSGTKIEGVLLGPDGNPVPAALVQIKTLGLPVNALKGAMTNDDGAFSIKGIPPDAYRLCATTPTASGAVVVDATRDQCDVTLRLVAAYTGRSRTVRFHGMTLAEADYALAEHWGVRRGSVMVLDAGAELDQREPFVVKAWSRIYAIHKSGSEAGKNITGLEDLFSEIVDEVARQPRGSEPVSVTFDTVVPSPRGDVTLGATLKMRKSDIAEAQALMKALSEHPPRGDQAPRSR